MSRQFSEHDYIQYWIKSPYFALNVLHCLLAGSIRYFRVSVCPFCMYNMYMRYVCIYNQHGCILLSDRFICFKFIIRPRIRRSDAHAGGGYIAYLQLKCSQQACPVKTVIVVIYQLQLFTCGVYAVRNNYRRRHKPSMHKANRVYAQ